MDYSMRRPTPENKEPSVNTCETTEQDKGDSSGTAVSSQCEQSSTQSRATDPSLISRKQSQYARKQYSSSETSPLREQPIRAPIEPQLRDGSQSPLPQSQQARLAQLRARERSHGQAGTAVHLQRALRDIDRMGSALSIDTTTREMAAVLFRTARDNELLQGRTVAAVTAASLLAATRVSNCPRPLEKLAQVARIDDTDKIAQIYTLLTRELHLTVTPVDPTQYVGQIRSAVDASYAYEKEAIKAIQAAPEGTNSGHSPTVVAAAALYAAGITISSLEILPQKALASAAECSQSSIRNNYLTFVAAHPSVSTSRSDLRAEDGTRRRPQTLSNQLNSS